MSIKTYAMLDYQKEGFVSRKNYQIPWGIAGHGFPLTKLLNGELLKMAGIS
jgi:hypothetical protein